MAPLPNTRVGDLVDVFDDANGDQRKISEMRADQQGLVFVIAYDPDPKVSPHVGLNLARILNGIGRFQYYG